MEDRTPLNIMQTNTATPLTMLTAEENQLLSDSQYELIISFIKMKLCNGMKSVSSTTTCTTDSTVTVTPIMSFHTLDNFKTNHFFDLPSRSAISHHVFVSFKVSAYSNTDRLSCAPTKRLHSSSIIKQTRVKRFLKPTVVFYLIYSEQK